MGIVEKPRQYRDYDVFYVTYRDVSRLLPDQAVSDAIFTSHIRQPHHDDTTNSMARTCESKMTLSQR